MEENEKKSSLFESHGVLEFLGEGEGVCVCAKNQNEMRGEKREPWSLKELGQNSNDALIWAY